MLQLKVADLVLSHAVNFDVLASALHCNQHGGVALDVEDFMEDIGMRPVYARKSLLLKRGL